MPEIAIPDFLRPEGWRTPSSAERKRRAKDARRMLADIGLPNVDLQKIDLSKADLGRRVDLGKVDLARVDLGKLDLEKLGVSRLDLSKFDLPARAELVRQIRKTSKDQLRRASKELDRALPRRRPSPMPFAIIGAAAGLFVGWLLATSPTARPRIERTSDRLRAWISERLSGIDGMGGREMDMALNGFPKPAGTVVESDTYAAAIKAERTGVGVGPGQTTDELTPGG